VTKPTSKNASSLLAVTAGEPAGIGPELCLSLADAALEERLVIIADPEVLRQRATRLGRDIRLLEFDPGNPAASAGSTPGTVVVWPHPMPDPAVCGTPNPDNSGALLEGLKSAVEGCQGGLFAGMVTAPLQKSAINDAGIPFTGHTEFLADLTNTRKPVMLLVAAGLRVALASTHMPLSAVAAYITQERLIAVLQVLHADLQRRFGIPDPEIVVCGLNPHAGEGGHLGTEEIEVIQPVVDKMRAASMRVRGPLPADTAFTPAGGPADAVLAMYHDQGLPVLKYAGFGSAVNVTLGLPIVRTSVDHGTALDLAGSGTADTGSMLAAVHLAAELASR
jgi:4-hydroxythreonine-4-phosphate dehydrogenase